MAFSYYKSMTLAEAQAGTADSTDWPLTICLDGTVQAADADLKTVGNGGYVTSASGYDIRPYADSGLSSPLTFELVTYIATTGALEMHIKIPTLSASTDTVIYLAFGDVGVTTDGSSTSTWDSNFSTVIHYDEAAGNTMGDATANAIDGTKKGTGEPVYNATGEIFGCEVFDGTNDYVTLTNNALLSPGTGNCTISSWVRADTINTEGWVYNDYETGGNGLVLVRLLATNVFAAFFRDNIGVQSANAVGATSISGTTWYHVTAVKNGTTVKIYLNGAEDGTATNGSLGAVDVNSGPLPAIGIYGFVLPPTHTQFPWSGPMDEFRFSNTNRSPSWITADYNAQKASSTFITWGARQTVSGGAVLGAMRPRTKFWGDI